MDKEQVRKCHGMCFVPGSRYNANTQCHLTSKRLLQKLFFLSSNSTLCLFLQVSHKQSRVRRYLQLLKPVMINLNPQPPSIKPQPPFPSFSLFLKRAEEQEGFQLGNRCHPSLPRQQHPLPSDISHHLPLLG